MIKEISIYDILALLAPGTVVTVGVLTLFPEMGHLLADKQFSFGDFGLIVLVSYVMGNLVAGLGNFLESGYWFIFGGTSVARSLSRPGMIRIREHAEVERKMKAIGFLAQEEDLATMNKTDKESLSRRLYTYVEVRQRTRRIDLFNVHYGMNRGIAAGFIALLTMFLIQRGIVEWRTPLILVGCIFLALFRMHRFSNYYAGELVRQFLEAPTEIKLDPSRDHNE